MSDEKALYQKCAKNLIDFVLDPEGHDLVYREFCGLEPRLKKNAFQEFSREYVPAKLALGCVYWIGCCAGRGIGDKELQNLYFKGVMDLFASPKSLGEATRFSESLYASNADTEQSPALGVMVHLFHKLGLEAIRKPGDDGEGMLNAGFDFMMRVSEALKVAFEAQFDEFMDATEDLQIKKSGKKD
jgi:hypothetical protein